MWSGEQRLTLPAGKACEEGRRREAQKKLTELGPHAWTPEGGVKGDVADEKGAVALDVGDGVEEGEV